MEQCCGSGVPLAAPGPHSEDVAGGVVGPPPGDAHGGRRCCEVLPACRGGADRLRLRHAARVRRSGDNERARRRDEHLPRGGGGVRAQSHGYLRKNIKTFYTVTIASTS